MNSHEFSLKKQYFKFVSTNQKQCLICLKKIDIQEKEQSEEELLNQHLLSFNHLQTQYQILEQLGYLKNQSNVDKSIQQGNKKCLFQFMIAKELNQEGLNLYFDQCLTQITSIKQKKLSTQKQYIIILKRFYRFLFEEQTNVLSDQIITQFLENEEYKHDSISAINYFTEAIGHQISDDTKRAILNEKTNQLINNTSKAQESLKNSHKLFVLLLKNQNIKVAFLMLVLFELDLDLQSLQLITFKDLLQDKIYINKQSGSQSYSKGIQISQTLQKAVTLTLEYLKEEKTSLLIPLRTMRDVQTLLEKMKKEYKHQLDEFDERFSLFFQQFNLSEIKFIRKTLNKQNQLKLCMRLRISAHNNKNEQQDVSFPTLFDAYFSAIDIFKTQMISFAIQNCQHIQNKRIKRSKSELETQRNKNKQQMLEMTDSIVFVEVSQVESNSEKELLRSEISRFEIQNQVQHSKQQIQVFQEPQENDIQIK